MAVEAKEMWSQFRYDPEGGTGSRQWDVTGATSEDQALVAPGIIPKNSAFLPGSPLLGRGPYISEQKCPNGHYWVREDFGIPPDGAYGGGSPLSRKLRVEIEVVETTESVDKDLDGRPILDAAGNLLQGATRNVIFMAATAYKFHRQWRWDWVERYANTLNRDPITFMGRRWEAEHFRCCWIKPTSGIKWPVHQNIEIAGRFEMVFKGTLGLYPFQSRLMNAGLNGWYNDSGEKSGPFTRLLNGVWTPVSEPVKLNTDGTPLDTTIKVADGKDPVANPNTVDVYKTETTSDAIFAIWKKCRVDDLSGLSSIFF